MAGHRLAAGTDMRLEGALATYLSDVAAQLPAPRRRREAILAELRTASSRPPKTTSPKVYRSSRPLPRRSPSSEPPRRRRRVRRRTGHRLRPTHYRLVHCHRTARGNLVASPASAKPLAHRPDRAARGHPSHPADRHRDRHRRRNFRHHWAPDALAARNRSAPRPGCYHHHRHDVPHRRPHRDHHVHGDRHTDTTARNSRHRCQPHPHCLQHHNRAPRHPDAKPVTLHVRRPPSMTLNSENFGLPIPNAGPVFATA